MTQKRLTGDTYDASGNITAYPALGSLTYNTGNQTTSITPNGGSKESISYLSDGQTLPTNFGATDLSYNALGSDALTGANNAQILRTPDGQLLAEYTGGHPYYYLLDGSGSVAGLVNSTGALEDSYTYSPYGAQTATANNVYNPFAYESGLTIPGTKLIQFGDRNYSPIRAGWLQQDPTGQNSGYVYAGDDPINEADPSGARSIPQPCKKGQYGACIPKVTGGPSLGCILSVGGLIPFAGDVPILGKEAYTAYREGRALFNSLEDLRNSWYMRVTQAGGYSLATGSALGSFSGC